MKYVFAFLGGLILVPNAMAAALVERGYTAVGGEVLLPVLTVLIIAVLDSFAKLFEARRTKDDRRTN